MKKLIFSFLLICIVLGMLGLFGIVKNQRFIYPKQQPKVTPIHKQNISDIPTPTAMVTTQPVSVTDNGFVPQSVTIKAGMTVTWTNKTNGTVNVSSDPYPLNNGYLPLNLGNLNSGESLSLTFSKTGTYWYHNHIIPPQKGTIIVVQ